MIVTFCNRKGGTGKTVSAFMFGSGLRRDGYTVLYIDLDSQANLTYDLAAPAAEHSVMDVLAGTVPARDAVLHLESGDLIPASADLAAADLLIADRRKEYKLKNTILPIRGNYDFVILDTPPQLDILTVNALTAADAAVITAQADIHSLQGIAQLSGTIDTIKQTSNASLYVDGILITRYNGRSILAKQMRENLQGMAEQMRTRVYNTAIRECTAIREAESMQQDIYTYNKRSNGAADYAAFVNEFIKGGKWNGKEL